MKKILVIMLAIFFASVIGLFVVYIYPKYYNPYLSSLFWSLSGTSLGFILGTYRRNKVDQQVAKKVFIRILSICIILISISILIFLIFKSEGLILILIINVLGLGSAIWMLTKIPKVDEN
jgi:hypothetical protein